MRRARHNRRGGSSHSVMDLYSEETFEPSGQKITPRTNVYLSLYLVIFGFFVVLVNESELDMDKSEKALSSVKQTFFANDDKGVRQTASIDEVSRAQNMDFQETQNVMSELLPGAKFYTNAGQNQLRIDVAADTLFFQNTAAVRAEARNAMTALSEQLSARDGDKQVFITVARSETKEDGELGTAGANVRRAHLLAQFFSAGSDGGTRVLTGYGPQKSGSVSISIQTAGAPLRPVL